MLKPIGLMFLTLVIMFMAFSCSGPESDQTLLTAEIPLHLEEHLDAARIKGSEVPADLPEPAEWRFDEPQPEWRPARRIQEDRMPVEAVQVDDALRLRLTAGNRAVGGPYFAGAIYMDVPDWTLEDWAYVEVRARAKGGWYRVGLAFNYTEEDPGTRNHPFYTLGDACPMVSDGTVQTYRLSLNWGEMKTRTSPQFRGRIEGPWTHLAVWVTCEIQEEAAVDILSIRVVPKEHIYADAPLGIKTIGRSKIHRRTLYTHAPGRIEYRVKVPESGRLDFGVGVIKEYSPVTFRVVASQKDEEVTLFEETYADHNEWLQHSVDLSSFTGKNVKLALEADAKRAGTVALWAAPTLTGTRASEKPNIIFYVIDGGGADHMSVYSYNRRTTPNLERLATEGAVFEHAYSNATWTLPSTTSFMTSLHTSVLGGYKDWSDPMIPEQEMTMAHHMHRAGYQTAVFTSNPYAGTVAGLERDGVDVLRDAGAELVSYSSVELHEDYWRWRQAYPGEPYWVHFQIEDLHWVWSPKVVTPFAGLYVNPELRERYFEWDGQLEEAGGRTLAAAPNRAALAEAGIDPVMYTHARRGLHDEAMAHQDYQLGRLVERLKTAGEWEHTLLIVAADHDGMIGGPTGSGRDPMFRSSVTRVPLLVFWPGRIAGGQRFSQPVSMIDLLPTILDLLGLPMPEVMQGQSLAPLLLGEEGWEPRPVILDEFEVDPETGELTGVIEVVDGRWGASLLIKPRPGAWPESQRTVPLLLYDLWNDPYTQHSLHEKRPDLVEKYTEFLEAQFEAHQALGQHFTRSKDVVLTPEQLETLRSLGYIR